MEIRNAKQGDEYAIHALIVELAVFEKEPNAIINTPQQLAKDLFHDKICYAFVAEIDSEIVGFALYYFSYSTWKGKALYLEDIYIKNEYRKQGIGGVLFDALVQEAKRQKVKRMDWQVLEWNTAAIEFYKQKNATLDSEWLNGRLHFD